MSAAIPLNPIDFPLSGTRLIEASAGTGKTYTIAALYLRLILGHNRDQQLPSQDLLPPDILVVTFTEAATQELRERIRERLSQAARFFREQIADSDPFLAAIRADYPNSDWPSCARRLELAANWMDEAAVYTIHSWCNRMLQQHAFDSGSLFRLQVHTDDTELLHEAVRDYWRSFYYGIASDNPHFAELYAQFQQPDQLLAAVYPLLQNTDAIGGGNPVAADIDSLLAKAIASRQNALQALKQPWNTWANELKTLLETAVKTKLLPAKNYKSNYIQGWIDKIISWSQDSSQQYLELGKGFESLTPDGMAALANPGQTPPVHPGFTAIAELPEQLAALPSLRVELLKHAILWIRNRYITEKQRLARMGFDDMLTRLDQALQANNGPRLATVIRQQYPIALIDEFQDTDPLQYRIFSAIYSSQADNAAGCFMIGDPKQAIYSFRGADIYTYLQAHRDTTGRHYTLSNNYRSSLALVEAVNQLFMQADQQPLGAFRFKHGDDNPLPFIPVKAVGRKETWLINEQIAPALTIWHKVSANAIGMPEYRQTMAEVTASQIVELLHSAHLGKTGFSQAAAMRALQPSDIAILVRSGNEAKIMRLALAKRQLRSVYLSERDSIFASLEAADLLLWLKAMAEPRNERKVRSALSCATFGWSYQTLQQLALDEPSWEQQLERFLSYQQRWQQDGILPTLRQLITDYDLHTQLGAVADGERRMTNLLHLAELLQQASAQLEGEQALIRHLAEAIEAQNHASADENIIRLESDANLIKIITIHKSKGLEYPLVFLPFICSFREVSSRSSSHYRYHDQHQNLAIDLAKTDAIRALSDEERLQEDLRLLYVALTRASHACWLGIASIKAGSGKECQLEKSAMGTLLNWQSGMSAEALSKQLTQLKGDCLAIALNELPEADETCYLSQQTPEVAEPCRRATGKISDHWWIASYSALPIEDQSLPTTAQADFSLEAETAQDDKRHDEADAIADPGTLPRQGIHALPRGSGPGMMIHDLLEQSAHQGFATVQADPDLRLSLIQQRFSTDDWQEQHHVIDTTLSTWLSHPLLPDSSLSLSSLKVDAYQAELEFLIGADHVDTLALDRLVTKHTFAAKIRPRLQPKHLNGLLKGFIDLVFEHQQQYYLVDYKFNSLGNHDAAYSAEALEAAMLAKRYDVQSSLYMLALHRLLKTRLGAIYQYQQHMGGCLYWFLRGSQGPVAGRFFSQPGQELIEAMDKLFSASNPAGEPR